MTRGWIFGLAAANLYAMVIVVTTLQISRADAEAKAKADAETKAKVAAAQSLKAVARRDIPAGALVLATALGKTTPAELKALPGGYARKPIAAGDGVRARDLRFTPPLAAAPGIAWIGLPVARPEVESGRMDPGLSAAICTASGLVAKVDIATVVCPDMTAAYCTGFLRIGPAERSAASTWVGNGAYLAERCL